MRFDEPTRDRQPEAGTAPRPSPLERLKQALAVGGWNARAAIGDATRISSPDWRTSIAIAVPGRGVDSRVFEQVRDHTVNLGVVVRDGRQRIRDVQVQRTVPE